VPTARDGLDSAVLARTRLGRWLDRRLYRHPFVGASARRYAASERPAFADLDQRLLALWQDDLASARRIVDVGAGPGTVGAAIRAAYPRARVVDVEPSPDFAAVGPRLRARAEALPLATAAIDLAVSVSAIRHVGDRGAALAELRRVVRPGGAAWLVELDPAASPARIRAHAEGLGSRWLALAFGPLVVATAPPREAIAGAARAAGWTAVVAVDDPIQPVYALRLG
jgi:SAM-dependent methyltransferase